MNEPPILVVAVAAAVFMGVLFGLMAVLGTFGVINFAGLLG